MTLTDTEAVAETRARAQHVKDTLPAVMLTGRNVRQAKSGRRNRDRPDLEEAERIDATYDGLDGDWLDWLAVSRRYERKIPAQERLDFRHDLMVKLYTARQRGGEAIPKHKAYRIASCTVADFYRDKGRINTGLDCKHCATAKRRECVKYSLYSECPKIHRTLSLDAEYIDGAGEAHRWLDIIADDTAIDLDQWLDAHTWLTGCKVRMIEIAVKIAEGYKLDGKDRKYLWHFRQTTQMPLF